MLMERENYPKELWVCLKITLVKVAQQHYLNKHATVSDDECTCVQCK